ncbi:MAG: hypothetical protein K2L22_11650 [Muribaculaceae bacterium]|nr:hypothetical protein [Muribaculaceae bacterium]
MNTISPTYNISRLLPLFFMTGLLILSFAGSCRRNFDSRLVDADSKMEAHPDSALMLLEDYQLSASSSSADSAYYALLLTHARFKNFIDETGDSLISVAAEHFLDQGDKERASRALFLQGMIQLNSQRPGEAAVSFSKGLDIAREGKCYMWEGRNSAGLFIIYEKLMNGSEQLRFAKMEYDAFLKGGYDDWSNFAKLDILRGYNNIGQYDNALTGAIDLLEVAREMGDTILLEEVLTLMATCKYSLSDFEGALDSYFEAFQLDPATINPNYAHNIIVSVSEIPSDSLHDGIRLFTEMVKERQEILPPFRSLAKDGKFKEAYEGLEIYKEMQDSVLKSLLHSSVSESILQYEAMKKTHLIEKQKTERIIWAFSLLSVSLVIFGVYRFHLYKRKTERDRLEDSLEILRMSLASQMKSLDEMEEANRQMSEKCELMSSYLRDSLMEKYRKANELCDLYYQDGMVKSKSSVLEKEMKSLLKNFSDPEFINEIGIHIDRCTDGLYSSFNADFPDVCEDARRLFMFLTIGFSSRAICAIFGIETSNLYNRKSRLKKMLASSNVDRKEEYVKSISR